MRLTFRQGIVRYQTDSLNSPIFLDRSNGGASIDLIVSPDPTIVTLAQGSEDYLIEERATIISAWTGFSPGTDYWLYIDIDRLTGDRTFGSTLLEPITSASQPSSPAFDQHWFDLSQTTMKVWTGSSFEERIRVFLAKYDEGSLIQPYALGTQVGLNVVSNPGFLLFDPDLNPVRQYKRRGLGRFLTTTTGFISHTSKSVNLSFEVSVDVVKAAENIPVFSLVGYSAPNTIAIASFTNPNRPIIGIVVEDFNIGEIGRFVKNGLISNPAWNFNVDVGTPVFCGATGRVTVSVPQSGVAQQIGRVVSPTEINMNIEEPLVYR